jgi:tetratricopeptide (TPR) repeat protein
VSTSATTVVCVSASERTWRNLDRYCFNAAFRAQRHRIALAVGFNGRDDDALRYIKGLEPDHLFVRPNTGHDLANFDNILKRLPPYAEYILLHDDHWFHDVRWLDVAGRLLAEHPEVGVWGNLAPFDVDANSLEYYTLLVRSLGYEEMAGKRFPHFLQGLAGMYRGSVMEEILAMDGIPHLHRSVQIAAQVCERLFSGLLLDRGVKFGQIPPGYELYLVHKDHSIVRLKLEEAARFLENGDNRQAEDIFTLLEELRPHDAALHNRIDRMRERRCPPETERWLALAKEHRNAGRHEDAVCAYRTALTLRPDDVDLLYTLGNVLSELGKPAEALEVYRKALAVRPGHPGLHNNLGLTLEATGDRAAALQSYAQAIHEAPDFMPAHMNLGIALLKAGRLEEAEQCCLRAVECAPGSADAHYNLAGVLLERDRYDDADRAFAEALRLRTDFPEAWVNRGIGHQLNERGGEAIAAFRRAIALRPAFAEAHLNLAVGLLQEGAYHEGWQEYEWRFRTADGRNPRQYATITEWDGGSVAGKALLVYQEQGLGDFLQCVRFIPELASRGARVVVACQPSMHSLLASVPGIAQTVAPNDRVDGIDLVCPVFSLPRIFQITVETIPGKVPYLDAAADSIDRWRRRLPCDPDAVQVGIAWTGNPGHSNNRRRSLPEEALGVLLDIPGVMFHSLHTGAQDGGGIPAMHRYDGQLEDLAEVAALMRALDLVITVDTSFVHLAGGLGVPVWLLLNFGGDWRWMRGRSNSPWYPTLRIFRQPRPGAWPAVLAEVRSALQERASGKGL